MQKEDFFSSGVIKKKKIFFSFYFPAPFEYRHPSRISLYAPANARPIFFVQEMVTISYPVPMMECEERPISLPMVTCQDITENKCITVPEVNEILYPLYIFLSRQNFYMYVHKYKISCYACPAIKKYTYLMLSIYILYSSQLISFDNSVILRISSSNLIN